jgi:hypothetical protein
LDNGDVDDRGAYNTTAGAAAQARPFEKGRSGNPVGRRIGCRNKATLVAAALLAGEADGLTRKAVEFGPAGGQTAMRLCLEGLLPRSRERAVKLAMPPIESAADIAAAMKAVTAALAGGQITPGEGGKIVAMVDTFVRAIETSDFERRLQELGNQRRSQRKGPRRGRHGGQGLGIVLQPIGESAANSPQIEQTVTIYSTADCRAQRWRRAHLLETCAPELRCGGRQAK